MAASQLGERALSAHHSWIAYVPSQAKETMYRADTYTIRYATVDDVPALRRLVELDGARLFCGPALLAEVDGAAGAAVSLADGRVISDPSQPTGVRTQLLRMLRDALRAQAHS